MKISNKVFKINLIIFIITAIFSIFLLVNFLNPAISIFGLSLLTIDGCGDRLICDSVNPSPFLICTTIVLLLTGIIIRKKYQSELVKAIILFITSTLVVFLLLLLFVNTGSCSHTAWRSGGRELFQLINIQKIYYTEHGKYAESYEELLADKEDASLFSNYLDDQTKSILKLSSDNDPNTWSARVYIKVPQYNLCLKVSDGYWLVCNQDECYKEICIEDRCNKENTSSYSTFMEGVGN